MSPDSGACSLGKMCSMHDRNEKFALRNNFARGYICTEMGTPIWCRPKYYSKAYSKPCNAIIISSSSLSPIFCSTTPFRQTSDVFLFSFYDSSVSYQSREVTFHLRLKVLYNDHRSSLSLHALLNLHVFCQIIFF